MPTDSPWSPTAPPDHQHHRQPLGKQDQGPQRSQASHLSQVGDCSKQGHRVQPGRYPHPLKLALEKVCISGGVWAQMQRTWIPCHKGTMNGLSSVTHGGPLSPAPKSKFTRPSFPWRVLRFLKTKKHTIHYDYCCDVRTSCP